MLRDSVRAGVGLLIPAATHLLLRVYVGRMLGQEALGLYSLTFAVYSFALVFGSLGTGAGLTRHVASLGGSSRGKSRLLLVGVAQSVAAGGAVALILSLTARPLSIGLFDSGQLYKLLLVAAAALPGAAAGKAVLGYLNGERRLGLYAAITIVQSTFVAICTMVLVRTGFGVAGAIAGLLAPISVTGLFSLALLHREIRLGMAEPGRPLFSQGLLQFGLFITLINGVGLVQGYTDTLMLGMFLTEWEVGAYAAAILVLEAIRFPAAAARMAMTPRIAALWTAGEVARLTHLVNRSTRTVAIIVFPLAFTGMVGGGSLLHHMLGQSFAPSSTALLLLMPGGMAMGVWATVGALLSNTGHVRAAFRCSLISAGTNVLFNTLLIPPLGIEGAALATTASLCLGCVLQASAVHQHTGIRLRLNRLALTAGLLFALAATVGLAGLPPATLFGVAACWLFTSVLCGVMLLERATIGQIVHRLHPRTRSGPSLPS